MIASRMEPIFSDIRGAVYEHAKELEKAGRKILKLNTGNPGVFGFEMPKSVRDAVAENLGKCAAYSDSRGMKSVRQTVLAYHNERGITDTDIDDIFVTNGVSEAVSMLLCAFLDPGEEVLLPTPCYSLWSNCVKMVGGKCVYYTCDEENGWQPDLADMEGKITDKTRAVLVINPNNPTGVVYPEETLLKIARMAEAHGLAVFSDEIYDRLVTDGPFVSIASLTSKETLAVTFNGLSKSHLACGIRSGWMILSGNEEKRKELSAGILKLSSMRLCSNTVAQVIIPAALSDEESTRAMLSPGGALYERRRAALDAIRASKRLSAVENKGAFYVFVRVDTPAPIRDDRHFCMKLLEKTGILVVPGSGFLYEKKNYLRLVMLPTPEELRDAVRAIDDFAGTYRE